MTFLSLLKAQDEMELDHRNLEGRGRED